MRCLAYRDPVNFPVLLDSAARGALSRYSILAAYPQGALWQDERGHLQAQGLPLDGGTGFLRALESAWRSHAGAAASARDGAAAGMADPGPFRGGWMVFLGYELAAEIEPRLNLPPVAAGRIGVPAAFALRIPAALVYDHAAGRAWALAESGREALLEGLSGALAALPAGPEPGPARIRGDAATSPLRGARIEEEPPSRFQARVEAALDYIRAGDIYQANLSRAWRAELAGAVAHARAAEAIYERLRAANPAPFAALARFGHWCLLSSSPERLVRVSAGRVETRPIAGTRPRSGLEGEERCEIAALIAHPKERAEHVMLIDLERNDLGRICRPGSVRADEFMRIESYAHVHHIVSNVCGELQPGLTPVDVLRAVFPGGTITGCPKFRCMQIIAELEGEARQAYTGALGFINHDGSMDFNILIRSLTLHAGRLEFRAGAGIVADSDWQRELEETRAKARGLLAALE